MKQLPVIDQLRCKLGLLRGLFRRDRVEPEHEFLPAALEVRDTPPSPIGRAILWIILLFFVSAVTWATVGKIDIVAVAPGKIIPAGHSKVIQPLETASVSAIHVQDGQKVGAGQVLIELDASITEADVKRLQGEQALAEAEYQRLENLARWSANPDAHLPESGDALLLARIQEQLASLQALQTKRQQTQAEYAYTQQQVAKLQAILPIVTKRAESLKKLMERQMAAEQQYLEIEQHRLETQHDLYALEKKEQELEKSVQEVDARIEHTRKSFRKQTLEQLQEAERRRDSYLQELRKVTARNRNMTLTAPVAGVVQQLGVHTVGAVVTPAQALMVIVPEQRKLEVEALLLNKDIGFVREGQAAEVKVDAFNFTKYGVIPAHVTSISSDAIQDESQGWVYKLKVAIDKSYLRVEGKDVDLTPGMTVSAEIKTGDRRVVEYFLSPFLQDLSESVKER